MNPDKPFVLRGGVGEDVALHNRIAAIERIKFLSGIDLQKKSADYLKALDLEMYVRWYNKEPTTHKVDEIFCQRAAEVIKGMEQSPFAVNEKKYDQIRGEFKERAYQEAMIKKDNNAPIHVESSGQDAGKSAEQSQS